MCSTRCSRGAGNVTRQKTQHIWNKIFGAFFHWKPKRWRRRSMVNRILIWSEGNACNKNNKKQTKHENRPIKNIIKSKLTREREGEESTNAKWQPTTSTHSSTRRFFLFLIFFLSFLRDFECVDACHQQLVPNETQNECKNFIKCKNISTTAIPAVFASSFSSIVCAIRSYWDTNYTNSIRSQLFGWCFGWTVIEKERAHGCFRSINFPLSIG